MHAYIYARRRRNLAIMTINFFWILKCRVYFLYIFTSFGFYILTSFGFYILTFCILHFHIFCILHFHIFCILHFHIFCILHFHIFTSLHLYIFTSSHLLHFWTFVFFIFPFWVSFSELKNKNRLLIYRSSRISSKIQKRVQNGRFYIVHKVHYSFYQSRQDIWSSVEKSKGGEGRVQIYLHWKLSWN